ncbi:MAG: carboxypeptidase-like regulatory domain-containing protein [Gammaproteobacteria bacterium]|nr:carboxypeptidase regulatory-like domain-containing protein [Pseudomonadales bacterium]MCP5349095.1 carboxypeptidase regulatory-like domain-containing protein [Pseudomonadales bacterium]
MKKIIDLLSFLIVALLLTPLAHAQDVSGTVIDMKGDPLPEVTVTVTVDDMPSVTTMTDINGKFSIGGLEPGDVTLIFQSEGFYPQRRTFKQQKDNYVTLYPLAAFGKPPLIDEQRLNQLVEQGLRPRKVTQQPVFSEQDFELLQSLSPSELLACLPHDFLANLASEAAPGLFPSPLFPQFIELGEDFFCFDTALNSGAVLATHLPSYNIFYTTDLNGEPVIDLQGMKSLLIGFGLDNELSSPGTGEGVPWPEPEPGTFADYIAITTDYSTVPTEPPVAYSARMRDTYIDSVLDEATGITTETFRREQTFTLDAINSTAAVLTIVTRSKPDLPSTTSFNGQIWIDREETVENSANGQVFNRDVIKVTPLEGQPISAEELVRTGMVIYSSGGAATVTTENQLPGNGISEDFTNLSPSWKWVTGFYNVNWGGREFEAMEAVDIFADGRFAVTVTNLDDGYTERRISGEITNPGNPLEIDYQVGELIIREVQ